MCCLDISGENHENREKPLEWRNMQDYLIKQKYANNYFQSIENV